MQGKNDSIIRPVSKRFKMVSCTKSELSKADLLFLKNFDDGVSIKGTLYPFSIISKTLS